MMKHIALLVLLVALIPVASAGNVTIDIYENSDGTFFLEVDEGGLIECTGTRCIVDIVNRSGTLTLTSDDIRAIARSTSAEIGAIDVNVDGGINESRLLLALSNSDRESHDTLKAYIENTWMSSSAAYHNCTVSLAESKGALDTLDAKFASYDAEVRALETIVESKDRDINLYTGLIILLTLALVVFGLARSDLLTHIQEWKQK